ncbi:hypothetical protein NicSoilB8_19100 [Arthrobacter sp. NicSoilB8]|nr:hypothetical protein NicSoilB8_19100 [Arthrobacter sp. NicSoilB8]
MVGIGVGVDPGDDFRLFVCHDETALTFRCVRWNTKGTPAGWADKTVMGLFEQAPMRSCPPGRRVNCRLWCGGQINVKTNPHTGVSHTSSHAATQANSIITVHTLGLVSEHLGSSRIEPYIGRIGPDSACFRRSLVFTGLGRRG